MNVPTDRDLQALARKILAVIRWQEEVQVKYEPTQEHPSWYVFYLNHTPAGALELTDEFEIEVYVLHPNLIEAGTLPYIEEHVDVCDSLGAALHRVLSSVIDCQIDAAVDVAVTWS